MVTIEHKFYDHTLVTDFHQFMAHAPISQSRYYIILCSAHVVIYKKYFEEENFYIFCYFIVTTKVSNFSNKKLMYSVYKVDKSFYK